MAHSGRNVLIKINAGSKSSPRYVVVAQQQGLTISRQRGTTSVGHKDSNVDEVVLGSITVSITFNGLRIRSDEGLSLLRRALRTGEEILLRVQDFGTEIEEFSARLTSFEESHPHDGPSTYTAAASPIDAPVDLG
jgi:TP901-1 family phage major tail protein